MEQQTLSVEARTGTGKGVGRKLRAQGKVPGVIYGLGKTATITLDPNFISRQLLSEEGRNRIFDLKGASLDGRHALIKDYQVDPLSRRLVHVDLLEIDITKKITVTVPLTIIGKSVGVSEGGVLNIVERRIEVRCLPNRIPKHIDVDVTALKIGDSLHLSDLNLGEGVEKVSHMNQTLVTVVPPAKEEELTPQLTQAAAPEVITEKKPAEGDAAADGDKKDEKKK